MSKKHDRKAKKTELPSRHLSYMGALQHIAHQSQLEMARLMPHYGERGRIAEEIIKNVLTRILPRRFSVGTGVIFSADGQLSAQTDIVIYDNFHNSPLLSEFGTCIFPVEIVYATVEVKSVLTKKELRTSMDAIMRLRAVGQKKHYVTRGIALQDGKLKEVSLRQTITVPPRNYIVAFSQRGLGRDYRSFCSNLRGCLDQDNSHVHGVCVLAHDWFAGRIAYRPMAELFGGEGDGLLQLYLAILKAQQNFNVYPMDLEAYLPKDQPV